MRKTRYRPIREGNAVQPNNLYVPRPTEEAGVVRNVSDRGWFQVTGCRTQGKTSLVTVGVCQKLKRQRVEALYVDCGALGAVESEDQWVDRICDALDLARYGRTDIAPPTLSSSGAPGQRMGEFLLDWKHPAGVRLFIVIDEIDIPAHQFRTTFPALLRATANLASKSRDAPSVCLVGLRPLEDYAAPGSGAKSSVGPIIEVGDFDLDSSTVAAIAPALRPTSDATVGPAQQAIKYLLKETGGQPFLTMTLTRRLQARDRRDVTEARRVIDEFVAQQRADPRDRHPLVRSITESFEDTSGDLDRFVMLLDAYESLLVDGDRSADTVDMRARHALVLEGLCRERDGRLEIKSPLYRRLFDIQWIEQTRQNAHTMFTERRGTGAVQSNHERRVFVINTGGTLGMIRKENEVVQPRDYAEFAMSFPELPVYLAQGSQPFAVDSINVTPERWKDIARLIKRVHGKSPKCGFVVVHGTDTMTYTASALAFAFGQSLDFPIVFTGSQTTPDVKHGDARTNLLRACLVALKPFPEVMVAFGDELYRAVRARKRDERQFAGFESVGVPPLGDVSERVEVDQTRLRTSIAKEEEHRDVSMWGGAGLEFVPKFAQRILPVQLIPGLEPAFFSEVLKPKRQECRGIILQVLGAGNVTSVGKYGFHNFIHRATAADIPVLLTSRFRWRPGAAREYKPAAGAVDEGAIPGGELTQEAAVAKFRWAIAIADEARERRVTRDSRVSIVRENHEH